MTNYLCAVVLGPIVVSYFTALFDFHGMIVTTGSN